MDESYRKFFKMLDPYAMQNTFVAEHALGHKPPFPTDWQVCPAYQLEAQIIRFGTFSWTLV